MGQFCPEQGQDESRKEVAGLVEERWLIREGCAGNSGVLDMVDL